MPVHASSVGRAILAQHTPEERRAIYRKIKFEQYSETTPINAETIEAEIKEAEKRGYHQSSPKYIADLAGVALPLPLGARQLPIVVAGPTSRCLERRPVTAGIIASSVDRFHAELSALSARNHQSAVVT